jgi:hypothetical protein
MQEQQIQMRNVFPVWPTEDLNATPQAMCDVWEIIQFCINYIEPTVTKVATFGIECLATSGVVKSLAAVPAWSLAGGR